MAAFGLSYHGLTHGNIRHIYSYNSRQVFVPAPRPFGGSSQFLPVSLVERFPPRFYDYYPAFNMGLPRAPAFDRLSAEEIREMVDRMGKPIACQRDRQKQKRSKEHERSRRKVKAVRFRSPSPDSADAVEAADQCRSPPTNDAGECGAKDRCNKLKVTGESDCKWAKAESDVKVKSEKLPELTGKKSQEKSKRKSVAKVILPPINH